MNTLQLLAYYAKLLILQYVGLAKAYATITDTVAPLIMVQQSEQQIIFAPTPTSGTYTLSYNGNATASINWNDNAATVQTKLQALTGLSNALVTGTTLTGFVVNFVNVPGVSPLLVVASNALLASSATVVITISETDQTLPLALQNAFSLSTAQGVQLDTLAKYVGVTRSINTPTGPITLDDTDFLTLIQFAIVQNFSGSSLATIEANMNMFFPNQFIITDYKTMNMSYVLSSTLGSANLFTFLIQEKLLPVPMAVGANVFIPPLATDYFGCSTYENINAVAKPFNTYDAFNTNWLFLSYSDAIII